MNYNRKIKIAVLGVKGLPFTGGLELIMEEIGSRLIKDDFIFDVFVRKKYMTSHPDLKFYRGVRLKYSWGLNSKHFDAISHSITALLYIILNKYNIVYINAIGLSVLAFLPKLLGSKVIVQVHGLDFNREKWGRIAKLFLKFSVYTTVWFSDKILCVSKQDKQYFDNKFNTECIYIPNGVNIQDKVEPNIIEKKYGLLRDTYILFMARLVMEKGCHYLIEAYNKLNTDKLLIIAGDNNHREAYTEELKKNESDKIKFIGFVNGALKEELLSNAYFFVLPSTLEAMPMSLLEAMSYGNCVITSDLPELINILNDDELIFKTGDPIHLYGKLKFYLNNPSIVQIKRNRMLNIIKKNHDWNLIYNQYKKVLDDLIAH